MKQGFYFFVKFGLVLICILRFIIKNPLRFYWEKICSIHCLHFAFEKHQVLKDFSLENLETSPRYGIINYWGSILTLYITWGTLVWFVFYPYFFLSFFLSCFFFFFYWYFPRQTLTSHKIGRERESLFFLFFTFTR